jgi:hypothetical protein
MTSKRLLQATRPTGHKHIITPEKFLSFHAHKAQEITDLTRMPTDLYRGPDGLPRMVLNNWPCVGELIKTFKPATWPSDYPTNPDNEMEN